MRQPSSLSKEKQENKKNVLDFFFPLPRRKNLLFFLKKKRKGGHFLKGPA